MMCNEISVNVYVVKSLCKSLFYDLLRTSWRHIGLEILSFLSSSTSSSHFSSSSQVLYRGHCNVLTCKLWYRSYSTSLPVVETQSWSARQGFRRGRASRHCSPWSQCRHCDVVSTFFCMVLVHLMCVSAVSESICVWCWGKVSVSLFIIKSAPYSCVLIGFYWSNEWYLWNMTTNPVIWQYLKFCKG